MFSTVIIQTVLPIGIILFLPTLLLADNKTQNDTRVTTTIKNDDFARFQTQGEFNEIKEFLLGAIAGRGIKLSNTFYISNMLQRTRQDVGSDKLLYKNAEAFGFCSAILSRDMMESNPHHIVFCPYIIVAYELADQPGTIYLTYRRPFYKDNTLNDASLEKIDQLLSGIIAEVID